MNPFIAEARDILANPHMLTQSSEFRRVLEGCVKAYDELDKMAPNTFTNRFWAMPPNHIVCSTVEDQNDFSPQDCTVTVGVAE